MKMSIREKAKQTAWENFRNLPLAFVKNIGQMTSKVHYYTQGSRYGIYFTSDQVIFSYSIASHSSLPNALLSEGESSLRGFNLALQFLTANPHLKVDGSCKGCGTVNYFFGNDPTKWFTDLSTFYEIVYRELWHGINMICQGKNGQFKYTFIVNPGALPQSIQLMYRGAEDLSIDERGNLHIQTPFGDLIDERPYSYQEKFGQQVLIASSFMIKQNENGEKTFGFQIEETYDPRYPLFIDPGLVYLTSLDGDGDDEGTSIALDSLGNAYITGSTNSIDFPTTLGAFPQTYNGGLADAFVTKLNATGTQLLYSTYLGGSGFDAGLGIAVDPLGNAYITGTTDSADFPTTPSAYQSAHAGQDDVFVVKLNPSGSGLVYSTYLGGSGNDEAANITIDSLGNAYVTGDTTSLNFPVTPGAFSTTYNGGFSDVFVTKLNAAGSDLIFSTYLGGNGDDEGFGIAVDVSGNVYVVGSTTSFNFPVTPAAFSTTYNGGITDAFVSKLNATGTGLIFSTFLGGSAFDRCTSIALDAAKQVYVTGDTGSINFPTTPQAFQTTNAGLDDAFITKIDATGSMLTYSTYLGGAGFDVGFGIAVDAAGHAYIAGETESPNFPTTPGALQETYTGQGDAFVAKLDPMGRMLVYSTYLGGKGDDEAFGIAIDGFQNIYITGDSSSPDFPHTSSAYQSTLAGRFDAFVAKIHAATPPPLPCPGVLCTFDTSNPVRTICVINGKRTNVALVPFQFSACVRLTFQDDTRGTILCTTPAVISFREDVALCLPEPFEKEQISCNILDISCEAKWLSFFGTVLLSVTLYQEVQVEAEVNLLVPAVFCSPRKQFPYTFFTPVSPTETETTSKPVITDTPTRQSHFLLECIRARKVYDWVYGASTYTDLFILPDACRTAVQGALQAGHRIKVDCSASL